MTDRVLLYNCCDDGYTHFIPLFCASSLFSNDDVDIEIGTNFNKLSDKEEIVLDKLRNLHPDSKILIKYNFYQKLKSSGFNNCIFNGLRTWSNSIRFISEPEIHNKYTYISDIDIVMLMKNFYNYHIDIMNKYGTIYSNWNRTNEKQCLTGLHFCETDKWYPLDLSNLNLQVRDECLLKNITERKTKLNTDIPQRPVHGLHFSHGQNLKTQLTLSKKFVDELKSYKQNFFEFLESEEYNCIEESNTEFINNYIEEFRRYYNMI